MTWGPTGDAKIAPIQVKPCVFPIATGPFFGECSVAFITSHLTTSSFAIVPLPETSATDEHLPAAAGA